LYVYIYIYIYIIYIYNIYIYIYILKLQAVITPYRSSSSVFMMNNTPSGAKKHQNSAQGGDEK